MDDNTETATANDGKQTSATAAGYGAISLSCCFYIDKTEYGTYRALLIDNACLYRGKVYPMLNKQKMT